MPATSESALDDIGDHHRLHLAAKPRLYQAATRSGKTFPERTVGQQSSNARVPRGLIGGHESVLLVNNEVARSTHHGAHTWHTDRHVLNLFERTFPLTPRVTEHGCEPHVQLLKIDDVPLESPRNVLGVDPGDSVVRTSHDSNTKTEPLRSEAREGRGGQTQLRCSRVRANPAHHRNLRQLA